MKSVRVRITVLFCLLRIGVNTARRSHRFMKVLLLNTIHPIAPKRSCFSELIQRGNDFCLNKMESKDCLQFWYLRRAVKNSSCMLVTSRKAVSKSSLQRHVASWSQSKRKLKPPKHHQKRNLPSHIVTLKSMLTEWRHFHKKHLKTSCQTVSRMV
eukprot:PhF_6_TR17106/c0_g1_i1/m.26341